MVSPQPAQSFRLRPSPTYQTVIFVTLVYYVILGIGYQYLKSEVVAESGEKSALQTASEENNGLSPDINRAVKDLTSQHDAQLTATLQQPRLNQANSTLIFGAVGGVIILGSGLALARWSTISA